MLIQEASLVGFKEVQGKNLLGTEVPIRVNVGAGKEGGEGAATAEGGCGGGGDGGGCDGTGCSVYGIRTNVCLATSVQMPELREINGSCFYSDKFVSDMEPREKRFLCYWWWAVNVFSVRGKGQRGKLPKCVTDHIYSLHKNENGEARIGYKSS